MTNQLQTIANPVQGSIQFAYEGFKLSCFMGFNENKAIGLMECAIVHNMEVIHQSITHVFSKDLPDLLVGLGKVKDASEALEVLKGF